MRINQKNIDTTIKVQHAPQREGGKPLSVSTDDGQLRSQVLGATLSSAQAQALQYILQSVTPSSLLVRLDQLLVFLTAVPADSSDMQLMEKITELMDQVISLKALAIARDFTKAELRDVFNIFKNSRAVLEKAIMVLDQLPDTKFLQLKEGLEKFINDTIVLQFFNAQGLAQKQAGADSALFIPFAWQSCAGKNEDCELLIQGELDGSKESQKPFRFDFSINSSTLGKMTFQCLFDDNALSCLAKVEQESTRSLFLDEQENLKALLKDAQCNLLKFDCMQAHEAGVLKGLVSGFDLSA